MSWESGNGYYTKNSYGKPVNPNFLVNYNSQIIIQILHNLDSLEEVNGSKKIYFYHISYMLIYIYIYLFIYLLLFGHIFNIINGDWLRLKSFRLFV